MKRQCVIVACLAAIFAQTGLAGVIWTDDYAAAVERAKQENRYLLLNFSGSDWCGWCIKLDKEVLSKDAFNAYADQKLVLVTLDFPRAKSLKEETVRQNTSLYQKYQVRGYPTILLLDPDENTVAQTGYMPGGADAYVTHLQALIDRFEKNEQVSP